MLLNCLVSLFYRHSSQVDTLCSYQSQALSHGLLFLVSDSCFGEVTAHRVLLCATSPWHDKRRSICMAIVDHTKKDQYTRIQVTSHKDERGLSQEQGMTLSLVIPAPTDQLLDSQLVVSMRT